MIAPMTYAVLLDAVDLDGVTFQHVDPLTNRITAKFAVVLGREDWTELGRPARLQVTLESAP